MSIFRNTKTTFSKSAWCAYNTYRQGAHFRQNFAETEERLNGSRKAIVEFQWKHVRRMLEHAYETTTYYRALFDSLRIRPEAIQNPLDFPRIPTLEKSTIRMRLDDFISTAFSKNQLKQNATGGSSGTPLIFYQDRGYWNKRNLSVYYFDQWAGWDFGERQLIIWGLPANRSEASGAKEQLNNYWRNHWWFNGFNMTEEKMVNVFKKMERWRPQSVLAYASSLFHFAQYLHQNGLTPDWGLKGIISSAEMMYPHYRQLAEQVFQAQVYNRYGSREVGLIAMECSAGRMHINCNDLYLEIDSDEPYTQPGEIIVTQLNNYGMPFIRYRIGDVGVLSDEVCPCGNRTLILGDLMGRTTAMFHSKDGRRIQGGFFTQQFYGIKTVNQFQLIQESYELCKLKLVVDDAFTDDSLGWIIHRIKDALGADVQVETDFVEKILQPPSGKMAYTISKVMDEKHR